MSEKGNFEQQIDEAPEAWLGRLQAVSQEGMGMTQRFSFQHRKEQAERLVKEIRKLPRLAGVKGITADALERAKDAYHQLTPEERQQFALWLSQAIPSA